MLYIWLAFSFKQHARIILKIRKCFPNPKQKELLSNSDESKFHLNDLIEMNFLFRASGNKITAGLVYLLYLAAPLSMTTAFVNNALTLRDISHYVNTIRTTLLLQIGFQGAIVLFLWCLSISLIKSDKKANVQPSINGAKQCID